MWDDFSKHWPYYLLSIFAVASGQIGRLGQKAENAQKQGRTHRLSRARIYIELSMMPALASIVGSIAQSNGLPVWQILCLGVSAGWAGFTAIQIVHSLVMDFVRYLAQRAVPTHKNDDE